MHPAIARQIVEDLEVGEVSKIWDRLSGTLKESVTQETIRGWLSQLERWIGSPRRLTEDPDLREPPDEARVLVAGPRGMASITVQLDAEARLTGIHVAPWVTDGIRNIVIGSPRGIWNEEAKRVDGEPRQLGTFYAEILGMKVLRDDWIKVGKSASTFPQLAFGDGWSDSRPPRWPDPDYPSQLHLDIFVPDVDAAGRLAATRGATQLRDNGTYRVYADPLGHPFCLYPDPAGESTEPALGRVVIDCFSPRALAAFYAELLGMPERVEDSPERVVIQREDATLPMLAFQHVPNYVAPRWHDDNYPEQVHLDMHFNDHAEARARAERLGAVPLPPPKGSCPVYADPAGHPFCLCSNGGGDRPLVMPLTTTPVV